MKNAIGPVRPGLPARPRRWRRTRRFAGLTSLLGIVLVCALVAFFCVAYVVLQLPKANAAAFDQQTRVYFSDGTTLLGSFGVHRTNVTLDQVPVYVRRAIVATEDRTFYDNSGVSPRGLVRAVVNNASGGGTQGGSTISQQYVKNVHLSADRTYGRKLKEFIFSIKVNRARSKDAILEDYLNTIFWGRGAYGIAAAADAYFGVPVQALTPAQGAYLAGIIRGPKLYSPESHAADARTRWEFVTGAMVQEGVVTAAERAAMSFPTFRPVAADGQFAGPRGYLLAMVRAELEDSGIDEKLLGTAGLRVVTTFDAAGQLAVEKSVAAAGLAPDLHAGFVAVDPRTGGVLAMYGGADYVKRSWSDATQARKQAGLVLAPLALAAAAQDGVSTTERRWQKKFVERREDIERIALRDALLPVSIKALTDMTVTIGPEKVVAGLRAAGLTGDKATGLVADNSVALGLAAATPLELANAYGTLADGERALTHAVAEVSSPSGRPLYRAPTETKQVFDPNAVGAVAKALPYSDLGGRLRDGEGTFDRPYLDVFSGMQSGTRASKTAWVAGYSADAAVAVDVYREGKKGRDIALGSDAAAGSPGAILAAWRSAYRP